MALTILYSPSPGVLDSVTLDATLQEGHAYRWKLTDHPVESGADITDHVQEQQPTLTVTGGFSATPLLAGSDVEARGLTSARGDTARVSEALEQLLALKGKTVSVVTELRTYENVVLTDLDVPRDPSTGDALRFSAAFRKVLVVSSQTVALPAAAAKATLGRQAKTAATQDQRDESILHSLDRRLLGGALKRGDYRGALQQILPGG